MPIIHGTPELVCPKCGNTDEFQVLALIPAQLSCKVGGVVHVFEDQGVGLSPNSTCVCMECKHDGNVYEFVELSPELESDKSFMVYGQEGNA